MCGWFHYVFRASCIWGTRKTMDSKFPTQTGGHLKQNMEECTKGACSPLQLCWVFHFFLLIFLFLLSICVWIVAGDFHELYHLWTCLLGRLLFSVFHWAVATCQQCCWTTTMDICREIRGGHRVYGRRTNYKEKIMWDKWTVRSTYWSSCLCIN